MNDTAIRKYLMFQKQPTPESRKTMIWNVYNTENKVFLGHIGWKSTWRRYCFFPATDLVFDATCLDTIIKFIRELMDMRRHKRERDYKTCETPRTN